MTESYEAFIKENPELREIIPKGYWDYALGTGDYTGDTLSEQWATNLKKNLRKLYPKHGSVVESIGGFARNKAVIAVGAGPSFNINKNDLLSIYRQNIQFRLNEQPFTIIATNHQYKPLLEMGIFPHFTFLIEGGEHVYDQLCTDVPELGNNSILIASLNANHDILKEWDAQGKSIAFFLPNGEKGRKIFKRKMHRWPDDIMLGTGGNVLNGIFALTFKWLGTRTFIATGNDLSFAAHADIDDRRAGFYADGDYASNINSNRDEAQDRIGWMGIEFEESKTHPSGMMVNLVPVFTSRQFFVYKTWLEIHIGAWAKQGTPFRYYNCSEGGISGVVAMDHGKNSRSKEKLQDISNWKLMDEVVPGRWFTTTLLDAASEWMEFRRKCQTQWEIESGAGNVIALPRGMGGASSIVQPGSGIIVPTSTGIIS
jgi:hypothetical protein